MHARKNPVSSLPVSHFLCLLGVYFFFCAPVLGQDRTDRKPTATYTFAFDNTPVGEALDTIIAATGISVVYETRLVRGRSTKCHIAESTIEQILNCVLKGTGLEYRILSSGTFVLSITDRSGSTASTLVGRVVDDGTDAPIMGADVLIVDTGAGGVTDENGQFVISGLRFGVHTVAITHVAYQDVTDTLRTTQTSGNRLEVRLRERIVLSAPIVVNDLERRPSSENLGIAASPITEMRDDANVETSGALGVLVQTPGVQTSGSLGSTHIQGSSAGDHEYLIDGAPLFVPIKNGGFIGSLSSFAIRSLRIHRAGFDARYGSNLSGVIEIEHDIGADRSVAVDLQATSLSMEGEARGTLKFKRFPTTSWMVAGRTSLTDGMRPDGMNERFRVWGTPDIFLSKALSAADSANAALVSSAYKASPVALRYSDIHAAARMDFSGWRSLYVSFYSGRNLFGTNAIAAIPGLEEKSSDEYSWTNTVAQIRYNWIQGNRTLVRLSGWSSNYRLSNPNEVSPLAPGNNTVELEGSKFNRISMAGFKADFDVGLSTRNTASASLEVRHTDSDFSLNADPRQGQRLLTPATVRPAVWSWHAFVENVYKPGRLLTVTLGSRLTYIGSQKRIYVEPRLSLRADLNPTDVYSWSFRLSGGLYRQYLNQFDIASASFSAILPGFRFWIPLGAEESPPKAYHVSLSGMLSIRRTSWVRFETFYKDITHLVDINYADPFNTESAVLTSGTALVYGASISYTYAGERFGVDAAYEYSRSQRRLDGRFGGRMLATPWEQPHVVRLILDWKAHRGWVLSAHWRSIFGRSWAFRQAYYDYLEPSSDQRTVGGFDFSRPDDHTLPVYSQVDIGIAWSRPLGRGSVQVKLSILNLLNRANVLDRRIIDEGSGGVRAINRIDLPFIPLLSARIKL